MKSNALADLEPIESKKKMSMKPQIINELDDDLPDVEETDNQRNKFRPRQEGGGGNLGFNTMSS